MQYIVGSGAQQECQAVPAMAAHHNQVALLLLGEMVDFLAWLAVSQVAVGAFEFGVFVLEALQALLGLIELLLLQL
ncbi:hypothetical protein D3C84_1060480 [compost metagenome]